MSHLTCPRCDSAEHHSGYGLAAGPMGAYTICQCGLVMEMRPDLDGADYQNLRVIAAADRALASYRAALLDRIVALTMEADTPTRSVRDWLCCTTVFSKQDLLRLIIDAALRHTRLQLDQEDIGARWRSLGQIPGLIAEERIAGQGQIRTYLQTDRRVSPERAILWILMAARDQIDRWFSHRRAA
jgi:hypothetical protein